MRVIIIVVLCLLPALAKRRTNNEYTAREIAKLQDKLTIESKPAIWRKYSEVLKSKDPENCGNLTFSNCELVFKWNFLYLKVIKAISTEIGNTLDKYPAASKKMPDIYAMIASNLFCEHGLPETLAKVPKLFEAKRKTAQKCKESPEFQTISL